MHLDNISKISLPPLIPLQFHFMGRTHYVSISYVLLTTLIWMKHLL